MYHIVTNWCNREPQSVIFLSPSQIHFHHWRAFFFITSVCALTYTCAHIHFYVQRLLRCAGVPQHVFYLPLCQLLFCELGLQPSPLSLVQLTKLGQIVMNNSARSPPEASQHRMHAWIHIYHRLPHSELQCIIVVEAIQANNNDLNEAVSKSSNLKRWHMFTLGGSMKLV